MKILLRLIAAAIACAYIPSTYAHDLFPKREMRAAWIASVENIDWPSKPGLTADEQRREFTSLLDKLKEIGINAVVVQIRPNADALYSSPIEPWSKFLTGRQGVEPKPYYDPLEFMIEEAHKRCMEFHAWFNPYRTVSIGEEYVDPKHVSKVNPKWIVQYGKSKLLDPGLPQTREYVVKVIQDVVRRYDIDAVHLDDYFYPYKIKGVEFRDRASFAAYNRGFKPAEKDDWRRDNVNLIIKMLSDSIHATKPYVKFGISPFGIWRNQSSDPRGSATSGLQNYDDLYADILLWLKNGWIDYIVPQLYWHIGQQVADYAILTAWWANNSYGVPLYIGQGPYRINPRSRTKAWADGKEIDRQIRLNRRTAGVEGSVFFSAKSLIKNSMGISENLKERHYKYPAIIPPTKRMDSIPPAAPINLSYQRNSNGYNLSWDCGDTTSNEMDKTRYYVVYRFADEVNFDDPKNIVTITAEKSYLLEKRSFFEREQSKFYVTALDRLYNESPPSDEIALKY